MHCNVADPNGFQTVTTGGTVTTSQPLLMQQIESEVKDKKIQSKAPKIHLISNIRPESPVSSPSGSISSSRNRKNEGRKSGQPTYILCVIIS